MSQKPIFVATHPRACSTAFEMVFMTRPDTLKCIHEPFGDAFYYGPERLSERYEDDIRGREDSSFSESTYKTVVDRIEKDRAEGKRVFIKDITHYLLPPDGKPASIAPSLAHYRRGVGTGDNEGQQLAHDLKPPYTTGSSAESEPGNPTVVPTELLKKFHFTFLIRHPKRSIPSYYKCTVPPQDEVTGFYNFMPSEAGYDEVRRLFDYLKSIGEIGPHVAGRKSSSQANGNIDGITANGTYNAATNGIVNGNSNGTVNDASSHGVDICVIDADDLLDHPAEIIEAFCNSVGIEYSPEMLKWDTEEELERAQTAFAKWKGFHDDALGHRELKPRNHHEESKTDEQDDAEWTKKFGKEGAKVIRETVDKNVRDYEYLKQFAIKV